MNYPAFSFFRAIARKSGRSSVKSVSTIKRIRCPDGHQFSRTSLKTLLMTSLTTLISHFWVAVKDMVRQALAKPHPQGNY